MAAKTATKKQYTITIETIGYETYEVEAENEEDAREAVHGGKALLVETSSDWADSEWEIDEAEL